MKKAVKVTKNKRLSRPVDPDEVDELADDESLKMSVTNRSLMDQLRQAQVPAYYDKNGNRLEETVIAEDVENNDEGIVDLDLLLESSDSESDSESGSDSDVDVWSEDDAPPPTKRARGGATPPAKAAATATPRAKGARASGAASAQPKADAPTAQMTPETITTTPESEGTGMRVKLEWGAKGKKGDSPAKAPVSSSAQNGTGKPAVGRKSAPVAPPSLGRKGGVPAAPAAARKSAPPAPPAPVAAPSEYANSHLRERPKDDRISSRKIFLPHGIYYKAADAERSHTERPEPGRPQVPLATVAPIASHKGRAKMPQNTTCVDSYLLDMTQVGTQPLLWAFRETQILPQPRYFGLELLVEKRDFLLPYDAYQECFSEDHVNYLSVNNPRPEDIVVRNEIDEERRRIRAQRRRELRAERKELEASGVLKPVIKREGKGKSDNKSESKSKKRKAEKIKVKITHEAPAPYRNIKKNIYVGRKPVKADSPAVCQCTLPTDGKSVACGEECLNRMMMYFCDPKSCPCGEKCTNIPFHKQQGVVEGRGGLRVFWTGERGFGLKTEVAIRQGDFVMEYRGEIISRDESYTRVQTLYKDAKNYYFLDFDGYDVIDAGRRGNASRFVNHSCEPNLEVARWKLSDYDEYEIGIFAKRDIDAGEELTYNYGWHDYSSIRQKQDERKGILKKNEKVLGPDGKPVTREVCCCGSANCSGWLGPRRK